MIRVSRDIFKLAEVFTISRGSRSEAEVLTVSPLLLEKYMEVELDARSSEGRFDLAVFQGAPDKSAW